MGSTAKPTKTTNRIHFDDLDPKRFEDLARGLIHKLKPWIEVNHIGRTGNDDGKDIEAFENDEGSRRRWIIQCKRYQKFSLSHAKTAIDEATKDGRPIDVFLLVVGCDVSDDTVTKAKAYGHGKGLSDVRVWDASQIEAMLYSDRKDLLFTYCGIDLKEPTASREKLVKARIAMRERLLSQFRLTDVERRSKSRNRDAWEWNEPEIIIRELNDETYPNVWREGGIAPWFKVQPIDFYHNGFRVVLTARSALQFPNGSWKLVKNYTRLIPAGVKDFTAYLIGKIPFDNIVDFTKSSDEYGMGPTIFCRFASGGEPYESTEWTFMHGDNEAFVELDPPSREAASGI